MEENKEIKNATTPKRLFRSESDKMIAGVCGGMSEYFGIDTSVVRLLFVLVILLGGSGVLIYLVLWLVLPIKSEAVNLPLVSRKIIGNSNEGNGKPVWGMFLVGLGFILLLQNFGFARYLVLDKTWPVMLIIFGLLVLGR